MTYRHKIGGKTLSVSRVKRKQKRKRRRLVEANDVDWARWDAAAVLGGLTFAEAARRALDRYADTIEQRDSQAFEAARVRAAAALAIDDKK